MQFAPFTLHVLDWHTVDAVPLVHPPGLVPPPVVVPHLPFVPQTFVTHWFAAVQLVDVFGPAHVFVVVLHSPETHVAEAFAALHAPLWSPSFGIATPFARSAVHVSALRLQCCAAGQSASTLQPPEGMHVPEVAEHAPDWHTVDAVPVVHGPVPSLRPHLLLVASQKLFTHSFAAEQVVVVFGPAQVFVVALH
jgi:hypothetical protein